MSKRSIQRNSTLNDFSIFDPMLVAMSWVFAASYSLCKEVSMTCRMFRQGFILHYHLARIEEALWKS